MKRLFEVNGEYFSNKQGAKKARGEPTHPATKAEPGVFGSVDQPARYKHPIKLGPDHFRFQK